MLHLNPLTTHIGHSIRQPNKPSYININSNHPTSIIKHIPKAVNSRIRSLSSKKKIFHESSKYILKASRIVVLKKSLLI